MEKSVNCTGQSGGSRLRRVLTLRDLVLYGVVIVQPVAPMSVYGVLSERGHGHVVTAVLLAMVAMLCTGLSYGTMATAYPEGGSAFTYVSREIHPAVGWLTGWCMLMDFVLNPLICTCWCAQQLNQFFPEMPVWIWKVVLATGFTVLNLRAIRSSAGTNAVLAAGMGVVVVVVVAAVVRHVMGTPGIGLADLTRPFYDPERFEVSALIHGTSLAVLTYIGFDGISTLADEAENPQRNLRLATVMTCLCIGLLAAVEVYLAQLVWPASRPFPNVDTAYVAVAAEVWPPLFAILGVTLLVANLGSGSAAHLGAARLLYAMGRSGALPRSPFAWLHPKSHIPHANVLLIGATVLGGSFFISFSLGVELLNFGALLAFMGVNASAFLRMVSRAKSPSRLLGLAAAVGFVVCLALWLSLSRLALVVGGLWLAVGLVLGAGRTGCFRRPPSFTEG